MEGRQAHEDYAALCRQRAAEAAARAHVCRERADQAAARVREARQRAERWSREGRTVPRPPVELDSPRGAGDLGDAARTPDEPAPADRQPVARWRRRRRVMGAAASAALFVAVLRVIVVSVVRAQLYSGRLSLGVLSILALSSLGELW
ncbi:hypothetical protein FAF44_36210 [Nonomuraea sp. MG754425]|uniref:hypothetical protein n=1 Tax=Nonomuraea sp. MG754425 TaxID=2570319 RepID=UPI001F3C3000|nr:hypothetical protein [Nonomuraea sp. MG754425]MCF6473789.1 hypothetical protein [Nonomuraea sp. MG754425]